MAKKKNENLKYQRLTGLFIAAVSAFLFLALVSYSQADPSFSHYATVNSVHNWMGRIGSYTADLLYTGFGFCSFIIAAFLCEYSWRFSSRNTSPTWQNLLSTFLIFFVCISITGVFLGEVNAFSSTVYAGGVLGTIMGDALRNYLNKWGSLVVLIPVLCAAVMIGYDVPAFIARTKTLITRINETREEKPVKKKKPRKKKTPETRKKHHEPHISIADNDNNAITEIPVQATLDFLEEYQRPSLTLLTENESTNRPITPKELKANAELITSKLKDFGVCGEILEIKPGPVITMYEFTPAPGIKINKIVSLADDLAMALKASPVRVVAPIPGKNAVGIEIPNRSRQTVNLRSILASEQFVKSSSPLTLALGSDIEGIPVIADLAKMPHLLIAGATGTGKSVGLNTMILSLLFRCDPNELKFILIDPKRIELSHYEGIPHLLHPVVTDPKKALPVLKWTVAEMEMRYELFKTLGVKGIDTYNKKVRKINKDAEVLLAAIGSELTEPGILPRLVVIIDEMADLMMVNKEVDTYIARLAQMARAAGIHMVVATQRPSVDVVTGIIKANFPSRISFRVSSKTDSRTILDASGADQLLGMGDMLFLGPGTSDLMRVHGAYVSEDELDSVVSFIKEQKEPEFIDDFDEQLTILSAENGSSQGGDTEYDPKYDEALDFVVNKGSASISLIQRRFKIGYNRAARIIEQMEMEGILGPADTAGKPRKVLVKSYAKEMED